MGEENIAARLMPFADAECVVIFTGALLRVVGCSSGVVSEREGL
jgi:hypothetical protein